MERVLFGDNQFFGVNHMSEERARAQAMRFQDIQAIINVLDAAYDEGVKVFMCTTHERIVEVCDRIRANRTHYADFQFYPCMPYAHKYANAVTELGILGALNMFLPEGGMVSGMIKGGLSVARKDVEGLAGMLIDAEMKMFKGLPNSGDLPTEHCHRPPAWSRRPRCAPNVRRPCASSLRRRTRVHNYEPAHGARRLRKSRDREPYRQRQY